MRLLLTGASGYLGSVLAEYLAREPGIDSITGIDLVPPSTRLPAQVRFVQMDIRSPDLDGVLAGHDVVVHTAFMVQWPAGMPAAVRDDSNLNGARSLARAAAASRVRRFVHASSTGAYDTHLLPGRTDVTEELPIGRGDSPSYYANGKALVEQALSEILGPTGMPLTFFRPCYIVGPGNRAGVQYLRDHPINIRGHDARLQYVHDQDVAAAFAQAVCSDLPGAYNVVPDDFIRLSEVWKILAVESVPSLPLWVACLVTAIRWRFFGSPTHASWLGGLIADYTCSNARLRATGWRPRYGSSDALRAALSNSEQER